MSVIASMDNGFDYYSGVPVQNSIVDHKFDEKATVNTLQAGSPFEFFMVGSEGEGWYLDLGQSYFRFKVRVRTADAVPLAAAEVSCVQNLAHSMFQRIQVYLGDKEIGDSNALYPYRAYLTNLLSRGKEAQKTWMFEEGWWGRDKATFLAGLRTTDGNVTNPAALVRHGYMGTGQEIDLHLHPIHELFNSGKFIPPMVPLKIRFTPSSNAFVLKVGEGATEPKLEILDAKFNCRMVKTSAGQHTAILRAIKDIGPLRINLNHTTAKYTSIAQGKTTVEVENIYYGPNPNRIILAMVQDAALAGGYKLNPFNFQHFTVAELSLVVGGQVVPATPYAPDFANNRYLNEYHGMLLGLNKSYSEHPVNLTPEEFGGGYTVFAFDLTPDQNCERTISPQRVGDVRLKLKFRTALPQSIDVLLLAEYDSYLELDKFNNVTTKY